MSGPVGDEIESSSGLSIPRPPIKSYHSTSLPSTPHPRPVDRPAPPRSPPAKRNASNPSPRTNHSASLPPPRKFTGGCKYETAMANAKRRVPYSLGPDKLEAEPEPPQPYLGSTEEERLTNDMMTLYEQLLPSQESEDRRRRLVEKLSMILRLRWPDHEVTVNVFGSTGNKLGTTESDVDICITTDCREMEHVCLLADYLANQGMQRVVCISAAKVPIVKIWDPDLRLACDLNVNNPVALENTAMIRTYVDIDPRVRSLAMIIKHWTKRRVLNEAALGGTLSSYTWICMIINFLQCRPCPLLPALQQHPALETRILSGLNVAFDANSAAYTELASKNHESLGMLLFQFFRHYAHELDYETSVMSVRAGKVITKVEKQWHLLQDNRLCVEEPFNTARNLGNTADDTSVRGIHLELRRAFKLVASAQLARCCEEYQAPATTADELRPFERQSTSGIRPAMLHPAATVGRGARFNGRSNRQAHQTPRLADSTRRASSASLKAQAYNAHQVPLTANPTQAEMSMQAQQRQYLLHDQLYLQYQYLQAQEQELRAQLQHQALSRGRAGPVTPYSPVSLSHGPLPSVQEELLRARAGRGTPAPLSLPVRPHGSSFSHPYGARPVRYGTNTNPPSPSLNTIMPEVRRNHRRSSLTNGSTHGSLRAHSQPPRPVPSSSLFSMAVDGQGTQAPRHAVRESASSSNNSPFVIDNAEDAPRNFYSPTDHDRPASEYVGYYLGPSPPLPMYSRSNVGTPLTPAAGLGIHNGSISPQMLAHMSCNVFGGPSRGAEQVRLSRYENGTRRFEPESTSHSVNGIRRGNSRSRSSSSGPVVVNGSVKRGADRQQSLVGLYGSLNTNHCDASTSDDVAVDTPISSDEYSLDVAESLHQSMNGNPLAMRGEAHHVGSSSRSRSGTKTPRSAMGPVDSSIDPPLPPSIESTKPAERSSSSKPESCAEIVAGVRPDPPALSDKQARAVAPRLSPVTEARITPPVSNQTAITERAAQSHPPFGRVKSKGKAKSKKMMLTSAGHPAEKRGETLAAQPNGQSVPAANAVGTAPNGPLLNGNFNYGKVHGTGWQTQKRKTKHKKGSKSESDLKGVNLAGGEFLPLQESLRKGG